MAILVHFLNGDDEAIQGHYYQKEYRDDIIVQIADLFYEVYFYTEGSLKNELSKDGFFSLPGLIVLDSINTDVILKSVEKLAELDYFKSLTGYNDIPKSNRSIFKWYTIEFRTEDVSESVTYKLN